MELSEVEKEDIKLAEDLTYTCYQMYARTPTKLSPEIVYFPDGRSKGNADELGEILVHSPDRHNLLRPETVESLFYMWYLTENPKYRDWGWEIFQAFDKYSKTKYGFTSITNVLNPENTLPQDKMETFFLAETLKYLYLLFADPETVPLSKFVFNTEAHPLPVLKDVDLSEWD